MSSPTSDPCAVYETNGTVDIALLLEDAITLAACVEAEFAKLTTITGRFLWTDAQFALHALRNVQLGHQIEVKHQRDNS